MGVGWIAAGAVLALACGQVTTEGGSTTSCPGNCPEGSCDPAPVGDIAGDIRSPVLLEETVYWTEGTGRVLRTDPASALTCDVLNDPTQGGLPVLGTDGHSLYIAWSGSARRSRAA